jgi:GT2 family glycosyltransferase
LHGGEWFSCMKHRVVERSGTVTPSEVCVVTVTYGARLQHLSQVVQRLLVTEKVGHVIVVDNAASTDISAVGGAHASRVTILHQRSNLGPAIGFSLGIQHALTLDFGHIWLLDDDNVPEPGCTTTLLDELEHLASQKGASRSAVLALREDHQSDIAAGVPVRLAVPGHSSFIGFNVLQVWYKLWRRTPWGKPRGRPQHRCVDLPYGPYGGLLASREMFAANGLPRTDFVLYADDTEYTLRLVRRGGTLRLVTSALITDVDRSWSHTNRRGSSLTTYLESPSDTRIYYTVRNRVWLESRFLTSSRLLFSLNKAILLSALWLLARGAKRKQRFFLIKEAVLDGTRDHLGVNSKYPLRFQ